MKQFLMIILFFLVLSGSTYVAWEWVQKQAYVVFSRQYVQEVIELQQTWNSQLSYPRGRDLLSDFYYQRRWALLNNWAHLLVDYNIKLHLGGEFNQTVDNFLHQPIDFRDNEKIKFYALELKDRLSRMQSSQLKKNSKLFNTVVANLVLLRSLVDENKNLSRQVFQKLPQLEVELQFQLDIDTKSICTIQSQLNAREKVINELKQFCLNSINAKQILCQISKGYLQSDISNLKKVDQLTLNKIKSHWTNGRNPACD